MAFMDQFRRQPAQYPMQQPQPQPQQSMPQVPPQVQQALQTCQGMLQACNGDVWTAVGNLAAANPAFADIMSRNRGKTAAQAFRDETGLDPSWFMNLN